MAEEVKTEAKTPEVMLREIESNVEKRVEEKIESSLVEKIDAKFRAALADLRPKVEVVGPASEMRAVADQIACIGPLLAELLDGGLVQVVGHLGRIVADISADGPEPVVTQELQRLLYGLDAVLRLHCAQEDELFHVLGKEG